jgi:2-polyprenyl-3-methyl-5-hydroxy-6-metoxy-1,4-benzoquinol methylase
MDRQEWLKDMRFKAEALYDHGAHRYWSDWGMDTPPTHRAFMGRFLEKLNAHSKILSAACGAGRFDGFLLEAGHSVVGTDQSAGVLAQARMHFPLERYPLLVYEKVELQEIASTRAYQTAFDGIICLDAMEHIPPEDYPGILRSFQAALKPGGLLYLTAEDHESAVEDGEDLEEAYQRAKAAGLPVVPGEVVDAFESAYPLAMGDEAVDAETDHNAVYRYYPALEEVKSWLEQAGFVILEEGHGDDIQHIIARRDQGTS